MEFPADLQAWLNGIAPQHFWLLGVVLLCLLVVWMRPQFGRIWRDTTTDHQTGHYVFKDVAKAVTFMVGVVIIVFTAVADYQAKREISLVGAGILLSYALSVGVQKTYEGQENRRTADANGNPLVQAGTAEAPATPEPMPTTPDPPPPVPLTTSKPRASRAAATPKPAIPPE